MKLTALVDKSINRLLYPVRPYWTSGIYGFSKWIRRYGYYPPFLPICIYTDHGPGDFAASPYKHELESDAPAQFYHSPNAVERWRRVSNRPCYQLHSPFVFARKAMKLERDPAAKGSVFFVSHNTAAVVDQNAPDTYVKEISNLPERFLPVIICLHITDIRMGLGKAYADHGFEVVCAGDSLHQDFTRNFYRILRRARYALANDFGSACLYAVEFGLPFGLYGTKPRYFNSGDANIESGAYESYKAGDYHSTAIHLFDGLPVEEVTSEQRQFAEKYLGLHGGVSRRQMSAILYRSLIQWIINRLPIFRSTQWKT